MVRSQGRYFSEGELRRIITLLRETELSLPEIADRMNCSRSAIAAINRKFQIRLYEGRRSQWNLNGLSTSGRVEDVSPVRPSAPELVTN